ncbi:hypothetical protein BsWGS_26979 [Bradybaena similaris]
MDNSLLSVVLEVVYQLRRVGPPSTIHNSASLIRLLDDGEVTIGRGPAADYFVDSAVTLRLISRIHATIRGERNPAGHPRFTIISSGLNGTYINDRKMGCYPNNQQVLLEGDKVTFGHPGCSSIQPGEYAPQLDSEFQFIFECITASRAAQYDRNRNHSRSLHLSLSHLQKHSLAFKTNHVPRLTDSPLSNASTSEKENEVTGSACLDMRNILSNGGCARSPTGYYHRVNENCHLDSKQSKAIMYGQNTNNVFSLENNKRINGVHVSDILPNPVFPTELETCHPKLCFYNASGDLTLCDPSEFLSYSDIVKSFKSMSSHKGEAWDIEENGNISLPLSDVPIESKPDLPRDHETEPPASLIDVLGKPSEGFLGEIEVNSTVIVLSDEPDDDDDIEDVIIDGDNNSQNPNHDSDKSLAEVILSNSGPALPTHIIKSEQCHDDAGISSVYVDVKSEDVDAAIVEFPDNAEVNFGIEDIVEVTVTTENAVDEAVGVSDSVNEKREYDTDDDSDVSLPSLKSIKDAVQPAGTDMEDSDGMPSLMLMNGLLPPKTKTSGVSKSFSGLSYNGDDSVKTVICTCGDYKEKSKSSKSRKMREQAEAKCPKHDHHSRTSQADCESSRFGVSDTCDIKSSSDHRLKSKADLRDDDKSTCVLSCRGATKSPKTYKENANAESFSLDLVKDSKRKHVNMVDSSAFREAALKLKSVCSEVASKSPLSNMSSKSPSSYLYQSKSPPPSLPHLMTPSSNSPSKSPLSELSQSKSPSILLPQSRSPYFSTQNVSPSKAQELNPHASSVSTLPMTAAPITNTTTIILSSRNGHKEKSSRSHDRSKSKKHRSSLNKQSSMSSSSTRPSSRSSNSSEASLSNSRSSSYTSLKASSDAPSSKSKCSSDESLADSRSSASSSHSKLASRVVPYSRTSHGSSKSRLLSKSSSSSHSSRQSLISTDKKFFKDTVPNLYSSSDEEDTVQENKTEIVKKIYSPRRKQEGTAGKGHVSRRSASFKPHKRSSAPSASTSSKPSPTAASKQVSPAHESDKTPSYVIRDLSPASSLSSNLSDVSRMDMIKKIEKNENGPTPEKKRESKPLELPKETVKPKPLVLTQSVMQLNDSKTKSSASKQVSSPSISLTSLPWMPNTAEYTNSYKKSSSKKTTSKSNLNQKNGSSAVSNNKSTTSLSRISGHDPSVKGSSSSHKQITQTLKSSKALSSVSQFEVKTAKKAFSNSLGETKSKASSVRDKVDISTKFKTAKTNSNGYVSKNTDLTSEPGKTNNGRIASDVKKRQTTERKPDDPKADPVSSRLKRTRCQQSSSLFNIDSDSSDLDDEPPSKRIDLRTNTSQGSSQSMTRSSRSPCSACTDKPMAQTDKTAGSRKQKSSRKGTLSSKTSTSKGKSKKAASKRGKSSGTKKKRQISDSSSDNDEEEDMDDSDDFLDNDSDENESWELPDGVKYNDSLCCANRCLNPDGKQVDWVMCDRCEQWYHVVCVNCPMDVVLKEDAQFHCGCR